VVGKLSISYNFCILRLVFVLGAVLAQRGPDEASERPLDGVGVYRIERAEASVARSVATRSDRRERRYGTAEQSHAPWLI
jgi:hypothetical protein